MIRTIIFDLGGVIVPLDFQAMYAAIAARCPVPASEIPDRIASTRLVDELERGRVRPDVFERTVGAALDLDLPADGFGELWGTLFAPPALLIPEDLFRRLRARYRMVLLSNTNEIHFTFLRRHYPVLEHFDSLVLSYELGLLKPEPAIYHEAIRQAGCRPGECFFTDDMQVNIDAARREGIDAERFVSAAVLERHLRERGIEY